MGKTLIYVLIIMLCYLAFIALFTARKTICEPMININSNVNQYISWINAKKQEFSPIKSSQILSKIDGEPDWELLTNLYKALANTQFADLVGQEHLNKAIESVSLRRYHHFIKEPIFLIKASQAILLTRNKTITALPREVPIGDMSQKNIVLQPFESDFNATNKTLENIRQIKNKIINFNKTLILDADTEKPVIYSDFTKLFITQIYMHEISGEKIPIYILSEQGLAENQVSIY